MASPNSQRTLAVQMSPTTPKTSRSAESRRRRSEKVHSSSPKKAAKQPLQIRMNLTETQMNEITTSFAENLNFITPRTQHHEMPSHRLPSDQEGSTKHVCGHRHSQSLAFKDEIEQANNLSHPNDDGLKSRNKRTEERRRSYPAPLQLKETKLYAANEHGSNKTHVYSPLQSASLLSPSSVAKLGHSPKVPRRSDSLYNTHGHWAQLAVSGLTSNDFSGERRPNTASNESSVADTRLQGKQDALASGSKHQMREVMGYGIEPTPIFSPMALYFQSSGLKAAKIGQKTLIGKNGWLERTTDDLSCEKTPAASPKRMGILKSIKRVAKEIGDMNQYRKAPGVEPRAQIRIKISLNPREQSLLYCELEYYLQTALNDFISCELERGHLVPDNLKKISDRWYHEHKSRVVGFRFDIETQIDLILLHADTFTFVNQTKSHGSSVKQVLRDMKRAAREMRVRTFCQPDNVIEKILESARALGGIIKVSEAVHEALEEVFYFFRTISGRERES